jgi:hypothetical protein
MNLTRDESVKKLLEQARPMQRLTQLCLRVIQKNEKQFADVRGDLKKSGVRFCSVESAPNFPTDLNIGDIWTAMEPSM